MAKFTIPAPNKLVYELIGTQSGNGNSTHTAPRKLSDYTFFIFQQCYGTAVRLSSIFLSDQISWIELQHQYYDGMKRVDCVANKLSDSDTDVKITLSDADGNWVTGAKLYGVYSGRLGGKGLLRFIRQCLTPSERWCAA